MVHIQKTGGTSIRKALGVELHERHKHRTAAELRSVYGEDKWKAYFKFAFVRNPWDRLVSWWSAIDRHRAHFEAREIGLNKFQSYILQHATTFEEFLTRCDEPIEDTDGLKHIFRNQVDYLTDDTGRVIVDRIGRFERLQDEMSEIAKGLGMDEIVLPRINGSSHAHYTEHYSEELIGLVAERYRVDIETFGYRYGT
jgi:hypothetical protein